ncbi:MAG: TlpA family protein disulfide reductase [Sphingobacteriales bacterium]|nr:TlpA family protein disulfide reductase [Sphingobacteriales bacterium]OJW01206.1 MAG: hypothetical protein BGO52_07175 [Sphingobacteriales bacterium 44-61]
MLRLLLLSVVTLFSLTSLAKSKQEAEGQAKIEIRIPSEHVPDSLFLYYFEKPVFGDRYDNIPDLILQAKRIKDGFVFNLKGINEVGYFSVFTKKSGVVDEFIVWMQLLEKGDLLCLKIPSSKFTQSGAGAVLHKASKIIYEGRGAAKFQCWEAISGAEYLLGASDNGRNLIFDSGGLYIENNYIQRRIKVQSELLNQYKGMISPLVFDLYLIDIYADAGKSLYKHFLYKLFETNNVDSLKSLAHNFGKIVLIDSIISNPAKVISKSYADYIDDRLRLTYAFTKIGNSDVKAFSAITDISSFPTEVQQKILCAYFGDQNVIQKSKNFDSLLNVGFNIVGNSYFKKYISRYSSLMGGSMAFDFNLTDYHGQKVKYSEFKGKYVFIDFWFTGCKWCEVYYRDVLKDIKAKYKDRDIVFITVSIDKSFPAWRKTIEKGHYTSVNDINLYTDGLGEDHPIIKHYNITGYPFPILIDRGGRIYKPGSISDFKSREELEAVIDLLLANKSTSISED